METLFDQYKELNINGSLICLEQVEDIYSYFCYPTNAKAIGFEGSIMYCFIEPYGEMVFACNPDTCADVFVYPLARTFEDFMRLILALLWSSFFVTLVAKKIVLINLCYRPCFIWGSITIITVWTNMIIINVCKFFYLLIECFLCCKLIQICAFILQGIEVTLHRCIVVRISCFAHALCHIYRFAEFGKCFGRIL